MVELLGCPFCGTTEMLRRVGARDGDGWGFVRCDYCDAEGPDPDNLKGHWNTRADLARPSQAGDERVARLVAAAREAEFDLSEWLECRGELVKAGFNMDGTEGIRDRLRAALAAMDTPKGGGDE